MTSNVPAPRGLYFEDFQVDQVFQTGRRTITSTDIVNFACLSGDFNDVHTNHEYCKSTPFGEPIAHGTLVFAVAAGLNYASGINDGTLIAFLGIDKWRMKVPVKHGDTIFVKTKVIAKRETRNPDRGVITLSRVFVNQRDEEVQEMEMSLMYRRRTAA